MYSYCASYSVSWGPYLQHGERLVVLEARHQLAECGRVDAIAREIEALQGDIVS